MVKNKATKSKQQQSKRAKLDDEPTVITLTDEEKRVIMIQYQKEHESDANTDTLLVEYLKFMQVSYLISLLLSYCLHAIIATILFCIRLS
jgi:hypothetical protein